MWQILEHRRLDQRTASLPIEMLKRYEKWKDIARLSGPPGLRLIRGFRDEALKGELKRCRSSRLGQQYRVIYEVDAARIQVRVIDLTAHGYRRK
jgi:plasmid maintenance system killer protein